MNLFVESPYIGLTVLFIIYASYIKNNKILNKLSILIFILLLWFYRTPTKHKTYKNNIVSSPAYGRIFKIEKNDKYINIIIILNIFDIHIQYYPINGKVIDHKYDTTGKFYIVNTLNKSKDNEKMITSIKTKYGIVNVYQIAGLLVRRIIWDNKKGLNVKSGDKLGMIKFGSRVDLQIPIDKFNLSVKEGDYVNGSNTIIGFYS